MMRRIFLPDSPYTKWARFLAMLWTLLIFVGCFTPSKDLPKVDVPLIDKWTHFVLFGGFTFLWLCAHPRLTARWIASLFLTVIVMGAAIELAQGFFTSLGRSMEFMDAVADVIGGSLGVGLFVLCARLAKDKQR